VSNGENDSRGTILRPEFSGPEDLDSVRIHLREARERAERKPRHGRDAKRHLRPVEENVSFERAIQPEYQATEPHFGSTPETSAPSPDPVAAGDPGAPPVDTSAPVIAQISSAAPSQTTAASVRATAHRLFDDPRTVNRAIERLKRVSARLATETPTPPSVPTAENRQHPKPAAQLSVSTTKGELRRAVLRSLPAFKALGWFSFAINILMLAGPLFMLQVYDRVMTSHSISTLVALSILTAAIYGVIGLLELVRSRVIVRIGVDLDQRTSERVFAAALQRSLAQPGSSMHALRELDHR